MSRSPPPYKQVLQEMDRVGVDMCMDVHGDETLPYNFISGSEGLPKWGPRLKMLQDTFIEEFKKVRTVYNTLCIHWVRVGMLLCIHVKMRALWWWWW
jgi:hypothetical protein